MAAATTTPPAAATTVAPARPRWSPRRRARALRAVQYVILLGAALALVLAADWSQIASSIFDPTAAGQLAARLPRAFLNTVVYTVVAFAVGLSLGTVLALMKLSSVRPYRWIATVYVEFFRGIPALLVVLSVSYAVPYAFGISINSIITKIALSLGLVAAAYIAETLRAGIQAVPPGQVEAARSLGMSHTRTLWTVVVPQAFRIVLPPMTNEFILLTKDTSLVFLAGLLASEYELTKIGRDALSSSTGGGLTPLFVIGACYLLITLPLGQLVRYLEKRTGVRSRA